MIEIAMAVAGSSALTTLIVRFFDRKKDVASVGKTSAETADILTIAQERALNMMANQLDFHQEQIKRLQVELVAAETKYASMLAALQQELDAARIKIMELERVVAKYQRRRAEDDPHSD